MRDKQIRDHEAWRKTQLRKQHHHAAQLVKVADRIPAIIARLHDGRLEGLSFLNLCRDLGRDGALGKPHDPSSGEQQRIIHEALLLAIDKDRVQYWVDPTGHVVLSLVEEPPDDLSEMTEDDVDELFDPRDFPVHRPRYRLPGVIKDLVRRGEV